MVETKTEILRRVLDKHLSNYLLANKQVKEEKVNLQEIDRIVVNTEEAQRIVQAVSQEVQRQAHKQIASVVSRCLEAVFGDEAYQFEIRFEQKRGKTEAHLLFIRNGLEVDPVDAAGGGVVDIAAFALRLACLVLTRPQRRGLLVLDEAFRFVSREYIPAVGQILMTLAKEMKVQIIMVTHNEGLKVGKVIELGEV